MDAIINALAGLLMHANPVDIQAKLSYDQFIGISQLGLVLILVGLAMTGMVRSGFPERPALVLACAMVALSAAYLAAHGGNPFDLAEKASIVAGGIFRFVGGVGVALGVACLLGMGRRTISGSRADLTSPVVVATAVVYALFLVAPEAIGGGALNSFRSFRYDGTGQHVWTALSIIAAWVSFAGLHSVLRSRVGFPGGQRQLAVVAAGVMLLVLTSFVASPSYACSDVTYAGCFPAGVVIGLFAQLAV